MKQNFIDSWVGNILNDSDLTTELRELIYWPLLNNHEHEKASRFARPKLQKQYVKTRGALRTILSTYLNIKPQEIIFTLGEYGKPFILNNPVFFNLSHSENKFVVVVSNEPIGVDIEHIKPRQGFSGLVDKCFSEIEKNYWYKTSEQYQTALFYQFWVRKEAFVKAVGRGIALGLEECIVNPESMNQFLYVPSEYGLAMDWKILDIEIEKMKCVIVAKRQDYKVSHLGYEQQ